MNAIIKFGKILTAVIGLFFTSFCAFSQTGKGLGVDAGMYFNDNPELGFHYGIHYHWLLRKHFLLGAGAEFFHTKLNSDSWTGGQGITYKLDNRVMHLNAALSAGVMSPAICRLGVYGNINVFAEPVPIAYLSVDKNDLNKGYDTESIGKFQYSRFSPGAFVEGGIYYTVRKNESKLKIYGGFGCGWYDVYAGYRHCSLADQDLSLHVPGDKKYYRVSIRLIGI